jgi:hypothetical protein
MSWRVFPNFHAVVVDGEDGVAYMGALGAQAVGALEDQVSSAIYTFIKM